jgi:hypothetical protein
MFMSEITLLRTAVLFLRMRWDGRDERGDVLTTVLLIAGFAVLAVGTVIIIANKVNGISTNLPDAAPTAGPVGP